MTLTCLLIGYVIANEQVWDLKNIPIRAVEFLYVPCNEKETSPYFSVKRWEELNVYSKNPEKEDP